MGAIAVVAFVLADVAHEVIGIIVRSTAWIGAAAVASILFVGVLGPGVHASW